MIPVTIIRHPKEKRSKCSLTPLEGRDGFTFHKATSHFSMDVTGYTLLGLGAPVISEEDASRPLLLLDSTWRLLPQLEERITGIAIRRTLPDFVQTAYPRISKIAEDPSRGLASVEALYLALKLMGQDDKTLLDEYYWKEDFLKQF